MNQFQPTIDEASWYPTTYALRVTVSKCTSCNEVHHTSKLWLVMATTKHPTVRREVPVLSDEPLTIKLPVVKIETPVTQQVCHECVDTLSTIGVIAPVLFVVDERAWNLALIASARANAKVVKVAKPVGDINELL